MYNSMKTRTLNINNWLKELSRFNASKKLKKKNKNSTRKVNLNSYFTKKFRLILSKAIKHHF